jgi:hypothetical protein
MRKAMVPAIAKEAERIAEQLRPYFRSRHRAVAAVQHSDWITHLGSIFLNPWERYKTLTPAIQCVEAVLKGELPAPYNSNPTSHDEWLDQNSLYLKATQ